MHSPVTCSALRNSYRTNGLPRPDASTSAFQVAASIVAKSPMTRVQ